MRPCQTWVRTSDNLIAPGGQENGRSLLTAPAPSHKPFGYESRSLRLPFFSLILPFLWSARPSDFLSLSPVRAPPASFTRPFALSIAPSFLSSLLLLLGTVTSSFPQLTFLLIWLDERREEMDTLGLPFLAVEGRGLEAEVYPTVVAAMGPLVGNFGGSARML